MKRITVYFVVLFVILTLCFDSNISASSGTIWESENNGDFSLADQTYDDYDNYGYISYSDLSGQYCGDMWKIQFSYTGYANFYLSNIPSGCNYDLVIYNQDANLVLDSSHNTGNLNELITLDVVRDSIYYIYIYSASGYSSSSAYRMRVKEYHYIFDRLGKKLTGGIYNRTYYIGMSSSSYVNPCLAGLNDWNTLLNPNNNGSGTDFYFTQVTDSTQATFSFWGEYQPGVTWRGFTRLFNSSGQNLCLGTTPDFTTDNWVKASIIYNTATIDSSDSTLVRKITNHEIGHAIGLAHVSDTSVIMYPNVSYCPSTTPTINDLGGARIIYP